MALSKRSRLALNSRSVPLGGDYDQDFWSVVEQTQPHIKASWDNLMTARHAIVHRAGTVNLTWGEMEAAYANTQTVIAELINAIGLTPADVQDL